MADGQAHVIVSGRVQGVYFREETRQLAMALGVTGWVRNRADGTVEAVFAGDEEAVRQAIEWCRTGPSTARVRDVAVTWEPAVEGHEGFIVQPTGNARQ